MINKKTGDILKTDVEALVNTVNCVGVMGRGIALQFRKAFPDNYKQYKAACERNEVKPGEMFIYERKNMFNPHYIINFPTKRHWRSKSRMEDIATGLDALVQNIKKLNIKSIAVPPLGCGLGELNWEEVSPMIERAFEKLPEVNVVLFEPGGAPSADKIVKEKQRPNMTEGRAALLGLIRRYLGAAMDSTVTLLEIHKLMYFMQEAGHNLRLRWEKGKYGPYARNLRHVLNRIDGHFIEGFGAGHDRPDTPIEPRMDALREAERFLQEHPVLVKRFERVSDLIEGFETPFGMELLSTVHWVAVHEGATNPEQAINKTYEWGDNKRMFEEDHIRTAWHVLSEKGWLQKN